MSASESVRWESHYGENDGDRNVHGMKHHREQSVTPKWQHKEKMEDIVFCGSTISPFHSLAPFPQAQK